MAKFDTHKRTARGRAATLDRKVRRQHKYAERPFDADALRVALGGAR